jgi:hypothetical protein
MIWAPEAHIQVSISNFTSANSREMSANGLQKFRLTKEQICAVSIESHLGSYIARVSLEVNLLDKKIGHFPVDESCNAACTGPLILSGNSD